MLQAWQVPGVVVQGFDGRTTVCLMLYIRSYQSGNNQTCQHGWHMHSGAAQRHNPGDVSAATPQRASRQGRQGAKLHVTLRSHIQIIVIGGADKDRTGLLVGVERDEYILQVYVCILVFLTLSSTAKQPLSLPATWPSTTLHRCSVCFVCIRPSG